LSQNNHRNRCENPCPEGRSKPHQAFGCFAKLFRLPVLHQ